MRAFPAPAAPRMIVGNPLSPDGKRPPNPAEKKLDPLNVTPRQRRCDHRKE
jgi:hypothetical protein